MAVADGFHVDTTGNLWLGSNRRTFDSTTQSEAKFYVEADGTMVAKAGATFAGNLSAAGGTFSGDISGASGTFTGDLTGADITGGTINIGSGTFQVSNAGAITATSGTIGGNTIGSSFIKSNNYSAGSAGWIINSDGSAEFDSVEIRVAESDQSSEDSIPDGAKALYVGAVPIYDYNGNLNIHPADGKSIIIHNGNPFIIKGETGSAQMKFDGAGSFGDFVFDLDFVSYSTAQGDDTRRYSNPTPQLNIREFYFENDNTTIFRANEQNADVEFFGDIGVPSGGKIYINGDDGADGEVLTRTATGMTWATTSSGITAGAGLNLSGTNVMSVDFGSGTSQASRGTHSHDGDYVDTVSGSTDALTISGRNITLNFGETGTRVAAGNHDHDGDYAASVHGSHVSSSTAVQALFPGGLRGSVVIGAGTGFLKASTSSVGNNTIRIDGETTRSSSTRMGNIFPNATSSTLGFQSSGNFWNRLFAENSTYVNSDERNKTEIIDIPYGLDYINTLEPKEYEKVRKIVRGCDVCNTPVPEGDECEQCIENEDTANIIDNLDVTGEVEGKKHFGFLAQDLHTTPPEPNKDIALVDYNSDSDTYAVAYEELIAPLVKAVQELSAENEALKLRVEALEG